MQIWDFSVLWFTDICLLNLFYSYLLIHSAAVVKGWVIYPKYLMCLYLYAFGPKVVKTICMFILLLYTHTYIHSCIPIYL